MRDGRPDPNPQPPGGGDRGFVPFNLPRVSPAPPAATPPPATPAPSAPAPEEG